MRSLVAASALVVLVTACGGSGSTPPPIGGGTPQTPTQPGGGSTGPVTGIGLPAVVEAVPVKSGAAASSPSSLQSALTAADPLPADSDYAKAETVRQIADPALRQLDILNVILNALTYAHHDDPAVVNQGPYSVMVPWLDSPFGDDRPVERLDRWVVDSRMIDVDGVPVNRVQLWASRHFVPVSGTDPMIQFDIREAPRRNAGGSYADYGVWTMSGNFGTVVSSDSPWMAASAEREANGAALVKFRLSGPPEVARDVVFVSDGASGAGWVSYWDPTVVCDAGTCTYAPVRREATYAYDPDTVTIAASGAAPVSKNRNDVVDLVTHLGFFDAVTGSSTVLKNANPYQVAIAYDGPTGRRTGWATAAGLYPPGAFPPGATVTEVSGAFGGTPRSYRVSPTVTGALQREDFPPASIQDVKGIVTEKLLPQSWETLRFDGVAWCRNPTMKPAEQGGGVEVCGPDSGVFTEADFAALELQTADLRYYVWMGQVLADGTNVNCAYLANGPAGPGIYPSAGNTWTPIENQPRTFQSGDSLAVMVEQIHYVYFDGNRWMEKLPVAPDPDAWLPIFDPAGDRAWEFPVGEWVQLYWDRTEYLVRRPDASTWDVRFSFLRWSNPSSAWRFTSGVRVMGPSQVTGQYYVFDNDPVSPTFLKLLSYDASPPPGAAGTVVDTTVGVDAVYGVTNVRYTWSPSQTANYLMDGSSYVPLSDTIRFNPVHLPNRAGEDHAYLMQAWGPYIQTIPGLAAARKALEASGYQMTRAIADGVVAIPAGTVIEEYRPLPGSNVPLYVLKPLRIEQYLTASDAAPLDLTRAATLKQVPMPTYVAPSPSSTGIPNEAEAPLRFQ